MRHWHGRAGGWRGLLGGGLLLGAAGCASPGRPQPPSLKLPAVVTDLRAERVGGEVELTWTTPSETTDGVGLKGPVTAEICRDVVGTAGTRNRSLPCTVERRVSVPQGETAEVDALPAELESDPVRALVYQVRLVNAKGKSAGVSNAAYAAAGAAPEEVRGLRAEPAANGMRLEWTRTSGPETEVTLRRTPAGAAAVASGTAAAASVAAPEKNAADEKKRVGLEGRHGKGRASRAGEKGLEEMEVPARDGDPGGAVDATAVRDGSYRYEVTRVRRVEVAGEKLELRGPASAAVTARMQDIAAPGVPTGLEAVADGASVALSWSPDFDTDLAGYRVYRAVVTGDGAAATMGTWERLTAAPIGVPAFRDTAPRAGVYAYRVTAVDRTGNESAPGAAIRVAVDGGSTP